MRRPAPHPEGPHRVLIVGGGFAGLAAARTLRRAPVALTVVDRAAHDRVRRRLRRQANATAVLAQVAGVDLGARTVRAVGPDGEPIALGYDTLIVAAGFTATPLAAQLAEAARADRDAAGRLRVRADLTLPGHPEVLAVGDMVTLRDVPAIAPAVVQQGRHAGYTVCRRLAGRSPEGRFRYVDAVGPAILGRLRVRVSQRSLTASA